MKEKNPKKLITIILIVFVIVSVVMLVSNMMKKSANRNTTPPGTGTPPTLTPEGTPSPGSNDENNNQKKNDKIIVYYFHGNVRCATCKKIEALTKKTLRTKFADELKDENVEWKVVNVDNAENKHFVTDYKLHTRSVVLSDIKNGEEMRWKNLEKVWELVGNEEKFSKYISDEINNYPGEK
ncbi:MAG: nitrophenyl compound nitroreductase subunit ArsF family protein [Candidatus Eremiobacteraeota bacterium]|nr:nitrophenyl compound nitroreductase subunit ArsF family protein [Candidatus Eremiobacteraeota bacterium]